MVQGGDYLKGDGFGSESIYSENFFADETFEILHSKEGILSMANAGVDTNGSQFFITTVPTPHLDNHHVAFGEVLTGMEIVKLIEAAGTEGGVPTQSVVISDCGELHM